MPWRLLLAVLSGVAASIPPPLIGNEVIGDPHISCESQHITVSAKMKSEFGGNFYAKGFFSVPNCHIRGNFSTLIAQLTVPTTDACGVRRKRMTGKKGLELEVTVVLMFHPMFLTKGDRAFNVRCIYSEVETKVTRMLDVSTLAPTDLPAADLVASDQQQPMCQYDVLQGGPMGKHVRFATIGDTVYHRWTCMTTNDDQYCMTVHSCNADDGQGNGQELVDVDGCTVDSFLLPNLEPGQGLTVGQQTQVFKFADRPTVYFSCMIRLMPKTEEDNCPRPEEFCNLRDTDDDFPEPKDFKPNETSRKKLLRRIRQTKKHTLEMDVSAPAIDVFDVRAQENNLNLVTAPPIQTKDVCISKTIFAALAALSICFTIVIIVSVCLIRRSLTKRPQMLFPPPY